VLDYVLKGSVCVSHVMCVADLLGLQIYTGSFEKVVSKEKWCATFLKADTAWDWVQLSMVEGGFPQVRGLGCCRIQF
jgi:hypothetical protein